MKKIGLLAAAITLLVTPSWAADMALKAARPALAPVYSWTGCYIGANIGGAWSHKDFHFGNENEGSNTADGVAGGGQIGCDYQVTSNLVIGIQGMFDGTSVRGLDVDPNNDGDTYSTRIHWFGTVTGRVGFLAAPSLLIYGKGGAAWVNEDHTYFSNGLVDDTSGNISRFGWDAGAGLEWMFAPNWSVWVEYDHMSFGTKDVRLSAPDGGGFNERIKQTVDKVLVGVNWRFNWGGVPTGVVAKY